MGMHLRKNGISKNMKYGGKKKATEIEYAYRYFSKLIAKPFI